MASYFVSGYTPPSGVTNNEQVKALQKQLGVAADGVWGPKTQAAYEKSNGVTASTVPTGFSNALKDSLSMIQSYTPSISYTPTSEATLRSNISSYLRPAVDQAIVNRQRQTTANKANIDADAAARGMDASSWVTDVKNRQQNAEASDIGAMESNYGATLSQQLAQALAQEKQNQLAAQQYNASAQQSALTNALSLAQTLYGQSLAQSTGRPKSDPYGPFFDEVEDHQRNLVANKKNRATLPQTTITKGGTIGGALGTNNAKRNLLIAQ